MSTFTVQAAAKKKDVTTKHGEKQVIALTLDDGQGQPRVAEWLTNTSTPLPQPGSTIEGDVTRGQYGWDFHKPKGNFNNGGGQRQAFKEDPAKAVRIVRQHSQTASIALIEMAVGLGIIEKPESSAALLELVRKTADWLDKDVATTVANASLSVDDAQRRSEDGF